MIEECLRLGVSIAALAHGLNANMLRKGVIDAEHKLITAPPSATPAPEPPSLPPPTLILLALPSAKVDGKTRTPT